MPRYLKDLPPSNKGRYERKPNPEHVKLVKAMKKKPQTWMMVREFGYPQGASAFARNIRENKFIAFREGQWEAKSVGTQAFARFMSD